jgi:hypothetical protein
MLYLLKLTESSDSTPVYVSADTGIVSFNRAKGKTTTTVTFLSGSTTQVNETPDQIVSLVVLANAADQALVTTAGRAQQHSVYQIANGIAVGS